jgi:hypothetical protein
MENQIKTKTQTENYIENVLSHYDEIMNDEVFLTNLLENQRFRNSFLRGLKDNLETAVRQKAIDIKNSININ